MAASKETTEVMSVGKHEGSTSAAYAQDKVKEVKRTGMGEARSGTNAPLSSKRPKPFVLRKWDAVAFWTWDLASENCAICRNHIMERCIECVGGADLSKADGECRVVWGVCNHAFHLDCITKWLKARSVCPLDNSPWETARIA